jgi:hypothetical protein
LKDFKKDTTSQRITDLNVEYSISTHINPSLFLGFSGVIAGPIFTELTQRGEKKKVPRNWYKARSIM